MAAFYLQQATAQLLLAESNLPVVGCNLDKPPKTQVASSELAREMGENNVRMCGLQMALQLLLQRKQN